MNRLRFIFLFWLSFSLLLCDTTVISFIIDLHFIVTHSYVKWKDSFASSLVLIPVLILGNQQPFSESQEILDFKNFQLHLELYVERLSRLRRERHQLIYTSIYDELWSMQFQTDLTISLNQNCRTKYECNSIITKI
jgi:hypothetical protein